jgi:hypothetical protein
MQCILYKIYFFECFSYVLQIDMHFICTPMWTKFYSCEKWVLHKFTRLAYSSHIMAMTPTNDTGVVSPMGFPMVGSLITARDLKAKPARRVRAAQSDQSEG